MNTTKEIFSKQVKMKFGLACLMLAISFACAASTFAQTTEFTYQGKLSVTGTPTATYDFEFYLCDSLAADCSLPLASNSKPGVTVINGIFTVTLNFGEGNLEGADRFLEIRVKRPAENTFTTLAPRQKITSAPYSIKSKNTDNASRLGGTAANQFVQTTDSRLSDSRNPSPGSGNYIQNSTTPQTADFNISGNGTAGGTLSGNAVNSVTQYNINGSRALSVAGTNNLFAGINAGRVNTASGNSFVGANAGFNNTTGSANSFVGSDAGLSNTTGNANSFFGTSAGGFNTTGLDNSFFGVSAGRNNTTGAQNSFFGRNTGGSCPSLPCPTLTGGNNSFFGHSAGFNNTSGSNNSFVGVNAGISNTTGSNNTALGAGAGVGTGSLNFATAIGAGAIVNFSNTIVLGREIGSDRVTIPGRLTVTGDIFANEDLLVAGAIKIGESKGGSGSTQLCRNDTDYISTCSSSLRYKTNLAPFSFGLSFINQLKPISYDWKTGGKRDVGFGAEDVAAINPLFVTYNDKGEVEGVKYDRLSVAFVNAFKEQQTQIEQQRTANQNLQTQVEQLREQNKQQQQQIDALKNLVCATTREAEICKEERK